MLECVIVPCHNNILESNLRYPKFCDLNIVNFNVIDIVDLESDLICMTEHKFGDICFLPLLDKCTSLTTTLWFLYNLYLITLKLNLFICNSASPMNFQKIFKA